MNKTDLEIKTINLKQSLEEFINDNMIFNNFFKNIKIISENESQIIIDVDNVKVKKELNSKWKGLLERAFINIGIRKIITFNGLSETNNSSNDKQEEVVEKQDEEINFKVEILNLELKHNNIIAKYTIENFVQGNYNKMVFGVYHNIIEKNKFFSPLFIYGASGVGKTHFLSALGNSFIKKDKKVFYINDYKFTSIVTSWLRDKNEYSKINQFIEWLSTIDVLIIDDIQGFGNKTRTLSILFQIINKFIEEDKQIVIASDTPPNILGGFEDRLITRFKSGLVIEMNKPTKEDFVKIFKFKIEEEGLDKYYWSPEAIDFLSRHFHNSIRDMEGALKKIIFYIQTDESFYENPDFSFSLEKILEIFEEQKKFSQKTTYEVIIKETCDFLGVDSKLVFGKSRVREIVKARNISIWIIKNLLDYTHVNIGKIFGDRDHSTIVSILKNVDREKAQNEAFNYEITEIQKKINTLSKQ
ncbi:Chromosomal replication initiator protein dnaA [Mesomycoplasma conjunctivae]|uniref:Chromosomal replication initiator protein DnaA n=1 Tax=Mesomycoplasma conjunctivae (strain ATCC 25834 / NCTC 10147 / HRC/581) TaxID=572263 RepID=C5J5F8_MESCH|nr:chromosomal replication initiator protein DnaA [Mesomycoplasma conjunctivae]CAT04680.1 Chromosomal replication initiator protein dnaA [Mesomycoplasma conjunctivae]